MARERIHAGDAKRARDYPVVTLGNQVYVERTELPPKVVNRLARLAAFQNPEFYAAQAMGLPTFGKPRIISCGKLFPKHVALRGGCLDDTLRLLIRAGITPRLSGRAPTGKALAAQFLGQLTPEQDQVAAALLKYVQQPLRLARPLSPRR